MKKVNTESNVKTAKATNFEKLDFIFRRKIQRMIYSTLMTSRYERTKQRQRQNGFEQQPELIYQISWEEGEINDIRKCNNNDLITHIRMGGSGGGEISKER